MMISENDKQLAHEIAVALNDRLSIGLYRKYATMVPHDVLHDALQRVLSMHEQEIKVNRAAIFTSTIKQYLDDMYASPGD
ncbi:MAG: hypothetical protein ACP5N7_00670 [Candidatus Pacearchaeota archaeon]